MSTQGLRPDTLYSDRDLATLWGIPEADIRKWIRDKGLAHHEIADDCWLIGGWEIVEWAIAKWRLSSS